MLLFCYGANTNSEYLRSIVDFSFRSSGFVRDYVIVFDHFGMFANMKKKHGAKLHGVIVEIDDHALSKIRAKEVLYKMVEVEVEVEVGAGHGETVKAVCFQSIFPFVEIVIPKSYNQLTVSGYREHGLPIPMACCAGRARATLAVNMAGVAFACVLLTHERLWFVGLILLVVDLFMVVDELINDFRFTRAVKRVVPFLFFVFFKLIPPFLMAPYIFVNSDDTILKSMAVFFMIVDVMIIYVEYILLHRFARTSSRISLAHQRCL